MRTSDAARKKPELDARLGTPDLLTLMPPPPPPPLPLTPPTADAKEADAESDGDEDANGILGPE